MVNIENSEIIYLSNSHSSIQRGSCAAKIYRELYMPYRLSSYLLKNKDKYDLSCDGDDELVNMELSLSELKRIKEDIIAGEEDASYVVERTYTPVFNMSWGHSFSYGSNGTHISPKMETRVRKLVKF